MTRLIVRNDIPKRYQAKRVRITRARKEYDADYKGGSVKKRAKNDNGALSRVKAGSAAVFICELCDIIGMTLAELQMHYRIHRDRSKY